jgi:hypothetical protein
VWGTPEEAVRFADVLRIEKSEFSETHLLRISGGRIAEDRFLESAGPLHQLGATQFEATSDSEAQPT